MMENSQFRAVRLVEEFRALEFFYCQCESRENTFPELTLITIGSTSASTEETKNEAAATSVDVMLTPLILLR